ncbi:hypothetical protein ACWCXX_31110 [Streptomyces sp. NPDC001732]
MTSPSTHALALLLRTLREPRPATAAPAHQRVHAPKTGLTSPA